jgi:sigma-B regulation protein RsbU (phosphoserine phosphatase)
MIAFRQALKRLGKSGIAFLLVLALYTALYLSGRMVLAFLTLFVLLPLGAAIAFRGLRFVQRHSLWSVRNRLLFVYFLMGVLPIVLLFVLVGLSIWGLTNDLAIYLATAALERKLDPLAGTVDALMHEPAAKRPFVAAEMTEAFGKTFPGIAFYVKNEGATDRYPPGSPELKLDSAWRNADGLLFWRDRFYGWSLRADGETRVCVLAPLSEELVENLVPNLGNIELIEVKGDAGHAELTGLDGRRLHLPPALSTFDIPVFLPSNVQHYHINEPNKPHEAVLWVVSRPSAVR